VKADPGTAAGGLRHLALLYRGTADYITTVVSWIQGARARAEPVLIAVPGPMAAELRNHLEGPVPDIAATMPDLAAAGPDIAATGPDLAIAAPRLSAAEPDLTSSAPPVQFVDMDELGRNPARIVTAFLAFAAEHAGQQVWCLSEPVWPSRSPAEIREAARNEALLNVAMAGVQATVMCPYNVGELRPSVITAARRTHPAIFHEGTPQQSRAYPGSRLEPAVWDRPLPQPPRRAASLTYDTDLATLRDFVVRQAGRSGLAAERAADLVLSASEVAANTLRHTSQPGTVIAWHTADEFLCQITDTGEITDPLAGLRPPSEERLGGQGLWVVNKVCDLVEMRTGPDGTTIRLHMRLGPV
jgi:anti-sigma regulatory factor (Ser/Thr protein kinase)